MAAAGARGARGTAETSAPSMASNSRTNRRRRTQRLEPIDEILQFSVQIQRPTEEERREFISTDNLAATQCSADDTNDDDITCWTVQSERPSSPEVYEPVYVLQPIVRNEERYPPNAGAHDQLSPDQITPNAASAHMGTEDAQCSSSTTTSARAPLDREGILLSSRHEASWGVHPVKSRSKRLPSSRLLPPRDPLLHTPIVTPPCPILPGHLQTPVGLRTYKHKPELPSYLLPVLEQQFDSYHDAFNFYNSYAKHTGFGVRKGQKNGPRRYMYCVCQGTYKAAVHDAERQRDKVSKRTGCKAMMRLKERKDGTCVVKHIVFEHNHQLLLSPSMLVFLHSHKTLDSTMKDYIRDLHMTNVKHVNIMGLLSWLSGGRDKLPCTDKDVLNMKAEFARDDSKDDVQKLFAFFEEMKKENENFYFDIDVATDEDGKKTIRNIFWANASCRGSYADFGDCVTFDTTYKTNKYHMPLGVFVGVNNHLQSTIFGVALIGDESTDSFEWIFRTFLQCMKKQPSCILTDQCPSMAAAIPKVFGRTHHRLCRWHIMKKHKDHLAKLYDLHPTFKEQLTAVLNHPLMPTEFEAAWHDLMDRYNLQNDSVMINLWNERTTWISAYWKEVFCARMTSTQRSESMNHILKKGFVNERQVLHVFAKQVNNCIQKRHELENAETLASTGVRKPATRYPFEAQLLGVYTRAVYHLFRERQFESTAFRIKQSGEHPTKYLVYHYNQKRDLPWSRHEFQVVADEQNGEYECECKLWDHTGLFCHHIIALLEHLRVDKIPDRYILQRYTKDANSNNSFNRKDYKSKAPDGTLIQFRRTMLMNETLKTVQKGVKTDAAYHRLMACLKDVQPQLDALNCDGLPTGEQDPASAITKEVETGMSTETDSCIGAQDQNAKVDESPQMIHPPPVSKTKGRNKQTARLKSGAEKPHSDERNTARSARPEPELDKSGLPLGSRLCSSCGKISGHNRRTCKKRELEQKLLQAHEKAYGPVNASQVSASVKKLLSKTQIKEEDESIRGESDEDWVEGNETDKDNEPAPKRARPNREVVESRRGKRACGKCGLITGHNSRTCDTIQIGNRLLEMRDNLVEHENKKEKETPRRTRAQVRELPMKGHEKAPRRSSRLK